jgi:hypothetical protein
VDERPALRDVVLAARRLNRLLRRALRDGVPSDTNHVARVLRMTESLVRRQLEAFRRNASAENESPG